MDLLAIAALAFVGSHFALSHPLRKPLVGRLGEGPFLGVYSLVALATMAWVVLAYRAAPEGEMLWTVGDGLWAIASLLTLFGTILFVGSFRGNPALPDPDARPRRAPTPEGVFTVTRHPMMWGFALWGIAHIVVRPTWSQIILAGSILVLALVGATLQDAKKRELRPELWIPWSAQTSFWPFLGLVTGRASWSRSGLGAVVIGTALWIAATWAHMPLSGWPAGVWRWIGLSQPKVVMCRNATKIVGLRLARDESH